MVQAKGDEADDGDTEGEVFHAFDGVGIVQGDIQHPWHVAGQQREGDGNVEQDEGDRCARRAGKRAQEQQDGEGNEKIRDLVGVFSQFHRHHIPCINQLVYTSSRTEKNPALQEEMQFALIYGILFSIILECLAHGFICLRSGEAPV